MLLAEQELRREAQRASRAKDEFLAIVSHELRTPLTAILGWTQLMQMIPGAQEDPQRVREAIERIDRSARLQSKLVDELLDLSRVLAQKLDLELEPTSLSELVRAAAETLLPRARDTGVEVTVDVEGEPEEDVRVLAHAGRLQQVFTNLVDNAIKFTPRGGHVHVRLERDEGRAAVLVEDDGEGIEPELIPVVFDRFRQGDAPSTRRHGGLGLGLAIVREIVRAHHGEVAAESEGPGEGARFTVTLPTLGAERDGAPGALRGGREHQG
jgi:signal transduction histidine kinase